MRDLAGKIAVVTGGASGIGRAMGARFARAGMKVVLGDVEDAALRKTVAELRDEGLEVAGFQTDVTKQEAVDALAEHTLSTHGGIHLVCNNAGIGTDETKGMIWESGLNDWTWAFGVNVWGILHGIRAFVPRMVEKGEVGHVVNTSSANGGIYPLPMTPIYAATKAAVTTITEVLHAQLEMSGASIKASVLFPGPNIVRTGIFDAARNRPADLPMEKELPPSPTLEDIRGMMEGMGMEFAVTEPEEVAEHAFEGVTGGTFWILPPSDHIDTRLRERLENILARANPPLNLM